MSLMRTPRHVDIEVTGRCNLHCRYCYRGGASLGRELSTEEWRRFFAELGECTVMTVCLGGGEPFLRNDLPAASGQSVSIVIPGQFSVMTPEFNGNRVTSFTQSTPPDATTVRTYTWNNLKPGTYAYGPPAMPHSATCGAAGPCVLFIAFESPVDAVAGGPPAK